MEIRDSTIRELQLKIEKMEFLSGQNNSALIEGLGQTNQQTEEHSVPLQKEMEDLLKQQTEPLQKLENEKGSFRVKSSELEAQNEMLNQLVVTKDLKINELEATIAGLTKVKITYPQQNSIPDNEQTNTNAQAVLKNQLVTYETEINQLKAEQTRLFETKHNELAAKESEFEVQKQVFDRLIRAKDLKISELEAKLLDFVKIRLTDKGVTDNEALMTIQEHYKNQITKLEEEKQILESKLNQVESNAQVDTKKIELETQNKELSRLVEEKDFKINELEDKILGLTKVKLAVAENNILVSIEEQYKKQTTKLEEEKRILESLLEQSEVKAQAALKNQREMYESEIAQLKADQSQILETKNNELISKESEFETQKQEFDRLIAGKVQIINELEEKVLELAKSKLASSQNKGVIDNEALATVEEQYKKQIARLEEEKKNLESKLEQAEFDVQAALKDQSKANESEFAKLKSMKPRHHTHAGRISTSENNEEKVKFYEMELSKAKVLEIIFDLA